MHANDLIGSTKRRIRSTHTHTHTEKQRKDQKQELELHGRTCFAALNIGHEIDRKNNTRKVHRDKLKMRGVMAMGEDQIQARNGNSICHTLR
jgi:hypothetical protein